MSVRQRPEEFDRALRAHRRRKAAQIVAYGVTGMILGLFTFGCGYVAGQSSVPTETVLEISLDQCVTDTQLPTLSR